MLNTQTPISFLPSLSINDDHLQHKVQVQSEQYTDNTLREKNICNFDPTFLKASTKSHLKNYSISKLFVKPFVKEYIKVLTCRYHCMSDTVYIRINAL